MDQHVIELEKLTKVYGDYTAVDQLSLMIRRGEIFGLLGPNGAGKSTTILMMMGLTEPTSGTVRVCGYDSTRNPLSVKQRVGYLPDDVGFYEELSGLENLLYTARLNKMSREMAVERATALLRRVGLEEASGKKAGTYSRGMRQRLGLADVLIKQPEVIILDEPTLGIDPEGVREFLQLIQELSRDEQITVLLSSHHLHQVQQICDRVGLFVGGRLLAVGTVSQLSQQLFAEEPFLIELHVQPGSTALYKKLLELPEVSRIERVDANRWRLSCTANIAPALTQLIVSSGEQLHSLTEKQYGLDEIYHRYFAGRDSDVRKMA
ncbi:ABC transporter ATP-binding protein [Brevibacillus fulvus]|uniref:ABC-2 type transport system ATP-binding protein n=1 Tax=Brevibacillus fulvus TaxID=1125967 RepID=A0A938XW66_9BACL|nr:ABC transporter ATP-binding protein [Brevibacillus fulvus]MBM7591608.1 ABC-2 type transport system ATP-binding protein [Brevibacillus fulvus]